MNLLIQKFFKSDESEGPGFQEVLFLNENGGFSWKEISEKAPDLPRGWFELSRVSASDRVEFTRDFWLDRLPYHPTAHAAVYELFEQLDDVPIVLTRKAKGDPFEAQLVYSFQDNSCFFRGNPPCREEDIQEAKAEIGIALPRDYLSFAKIHNGFGKLSEMGVLELGQIGEARRRVMSLLLRTDHSVKSGSTLVDPGALIPFYEAFGLASFQCFYTDWYPGSEMGNVYLSGIDYTLSDTSDKKAWAENLAFPTFLDWLVYYLEGMNLSL